MTHGIDEIKMKPYQKRTPGEKAALELWEFEGYESMADELAHELSTQSQRIAALEKALEKAVYEIKMQYALRFRGDTDFETLGERNEVIMAARALLATRTDAG